MRRRLSTWLLLLAMATSAQGALAQPAQIVPPAPETPTEVAYPDGGAGDARVLLELTIGADGSVENVRVLSGNEPFAAAALEAAQSWRFRPAEQGGVPRAARIRFEVRFTEPAPAPAPVAAPVTAATSRDVEPTPAAPIVVDVLGERAPPTAKSLRRAEVRQLPGAFGDPFRAIEAMPGVTPIFSGVPFFFVRGAPPGNVGYFLDGIRVPYLYHLGLGPSVVHPAMVDRVDFYPGAYPARFGRFAGGIVAGETAPPALELHGEAQVRLIDSGALVETPFAGGRGAALVGGRYSYTALMVSLLAPEVELSYWDYQGRVSYELGARDRLELFGFGAYDFLGEERSTGDTQVRFATEFHRIDLRHEHQPSSRTTVRTALALGLDRTRAANDFSVNSRMLALRNEIRHRVSQRLVWRGGADAVADAYRLVPPVERFGPDAAPDEGEQALRDFFPTRTDLASGVWSDAVIEPEPGVSVTPGVRVDYYSSEHATAVAVEPRVSASFAVSSRLSVHHAFGVVHQPPSFVIPVPGFQVAGLRGGLQRSLQASSGFELILPDDFKLGLTVFNHVLLNLTDPLGTLRANESPDTDADELRVLDRRALGSTIGAEVMLRRPLTRKLGGFLSYTLSRSTRMLDRYQFPSSFDRSHVLNLVLGYDLGRRWRAGSRFVFYTGFPQQELFRDQTPNDTSARVPAFWRVDLRLEKRWMLGQRAWWAMVFEVMNATLNREVIDMNCRTRSGETVCDPEYIGPVTIPSIGVEAAF